MRIKSLAQGENILMQRFEPATFVSKIDILTTTPIVHKRKRDGNSTDRQIHGEDNVWSTVQRHDKMEVLHADVGFT